jgi:hypothetical protein
MESVDKTQKWTKVVFNATDAVEVTETAGDGKPIRGIRKLKSGEQLPSGAVVIKNGWDHEHCEICSTHVNPGDYAFRNESDLWLCLNCFEERGAK